jgi:lysine/ornithine N-monooxygenase
MGRRRMYILKDNFPAASHIRRWVRSALKSFNNLIKSTVFHRVVCTLVRDNIIPLSCAMPAAIPITPLLIIGAGPHALALILMMLEDQRSSEFSEQDTIQWSYWRKKYRVSSKTKSSSSSRIRSMVRVIDPSGTWCDHWNRAFDTLNISHLRSPMSVHLDPLRPEGLRDFATLHQREHEITEAPTSLPFNKRSRAFATNTSLFNESDRSFFGCPSQPLFADFHRDLMAKYEIMDIVEPEQAVSIQPSAHASGYTIVSCASGRVFHAVRVVVAIGTQNIPRWPRWFHHHNHPNIRHFADLIKHGRSGLDRYRGRHLMVIGGGLTALQLTCQVLAAGASHVTLITRASHLRVQPYDVPTVWLSKRAMHKELSAFFAEMNPEKRLMHIQDARQGGSVTVAAMAQLNFATTPMNYTYRGGLVIEQVSDTRSGQLCVTFENHREHQVVVDDILLATGSDIDVAKEPLFDNIRDIGQCVGGLPVLDEELRWAANVNVFIMGGYAALRLGPMAGNLMGARMGASILSELFIDELSTAKEKRRNDHMRARCGKENIYDFLS